MKLHPLECTDAGWFTRENLPSPTLGAERWADFISPPSTVTIVTSSTTTFVSRCGEVTSDATVEVAARRRQNFSRAQHFCRNYRAPLDR